MQRLDDLLLAGDDGWVVERDVADADAEGARLADASRNVGALEPGLGRDAAAVEARAADFVALDEGGGQAELRGAYGGSVAPVPAADDYEIELVHYCLTLTV